MAAGGKLLLQIGDSADFLSAIIEPCAMSLELPPLVRFGVFLFFCLSRGLSSSVFTSAVFFAPSKVGNS